MTSPPGELKSFIVENRTRQLPCASGFFIACDFQASWNASLSGISVLAHVCRCLDLQHYFMLLLFL